MSKLIKEIKLIKTDVVANNNKFWHGYLFDDNTVKAEWGRVGYSGDTGQWSGGESYLNKKVAEKLKKGYTEQHTISTNEKTSSKTIHNSSLHSIAKNEIVKNNTRLGKIIDRLVQSNVHTITHNTTITYNSATGLFSTPLGIVTLNGIHNARTILSDISEHVNKNKYDSQLINLVNQYLRIIPQNVGMKLDVKRIFGDKNDILKQNDLLDSLESSYQALQSNTNNNNNTSSAEKSVFKIDFDILEDTNEYNRLVGWYTKSNKAMHGYTNIKVKNIFTVNIHDMTSNYDSNLSPHKEVFHGTSQANVLSILKSGLKVSPPSTAAIAGKMFGNGIYGAINSSKSLGYSLNRWGQGGRGDSAWLFICEFALGNCYETKQYGCKCPKSYDSIWAKASSGGLYHDELIVYKNNQVKIKYLLECQ